MIFVIITYKQNKVKNMAVPKHIDIDETYRLNNNNILFNAVAMTDFVLFLVHDHFI